LAPAPVKVVARELARLRALTKMKETDAAMVAAAYAEEVSRYPADAVVEVCRSWDGVFFPSWSELRDRLETTVAHRRSLLAALGAAA
jgi:hypothetical protein